MEIQSTGKEQKISFEAFKSRVLEDYRIAVLSRECSNLGRREVFSGKGKFGIFGDGKELPQLAMNHFFQNGDFRSGYYRDQTLLMAQGLLTVNNIFSALYADLDRSREPMSGGRQMGGHFVTQSRDENGDWLDIINQKNHSGDISPTGSQMPRLLGLAQASKVYREHKTHNRDTFSNNGNEIAWGTIGNASTSEGMFFETINAAGVMQVPMVISVWDDEYGISVSNKDQTTKESISEALKGFQRTKEQKGFDWVLFGPNNSFPIDILEYRNSSAIHDSIIEGKTSLIAGNGFLFDTTRELSDKFIVDNWKLVPFWRKLDKIFWMVARDQETFGYSCFEIIYSMDRTRIVDMNWIDASRIASGKRNEFGEVKDTAYLSAQQTKGADGCTVYINEKLRKQIKKYITSHPTLLKNRNRKLIFSAKGLGFTAQTIVNLFQRLYKLASIEGASSHSGRRQFV